jgi:DNA repair exonuclease SbcCD nuclease subunit
MSWTSLLVGDVHATPEELDDCNRLFEMIEEKACDAGVDEVCLMGDSYHTHQVIRAEVMHFYRTWFKRWQEKDRFRVVCLVGNHDYAGEGNAIHAMEIHEDQVKVVDKPWVDGGRLYMPYYADRDQFVVDANKYPDTYVMICHQTFSGASYENGFKAEDGVDPNLFPQDMILSGHIHTPQEFSKVRYLGAPRWRILTDANVERAIWFYEFDQKERSGRSVAYDTGLACRKIHHIELRPGQLLPKYLNPKDEWRIDIYGPQTFIDSHEHTLRAGGCKVRTFCTDRAPSKVSEAEGVGTAFRKFLDGFTVRHGTPKEELLALAQKRLHV